MKGFKELDKYTKYAIVIIAIGILIRFYLASIYHVSGDACWQLSNARFIAENKELPLFEQFGRDEPFWPPPLFHFIAAFVYMIFNNFSNNAAEFSVKMLSPFFSSLTLIFSFLVFKKLFDRKITFYSIIFLAFMPLSLDYGIYSYIDGIIAFPAVLSVYFALDNRAVSTGIATGLAILTKYNGIFIIPVLIYIFYQKNQNNRKEFFKKILILAVIAGLIGSVWFIRNWIYLGNPVWPFLNDIFKGYEAKSFVTSNVGTVQLSNIFSLNAIASIYLGIFGVPDGNIRTLHFFDIPYFNLLFFIWIIGTIIFIIPLIIGFFSKKLKHRSLLFIWIASFIILVLLYVINAGWSVIRFMLPAFPALALIWANGLDSLRNLKFKDIYLKIIFLIVIGFVLASFVKINLAANAWDIYKEDFAWIKSNTNKNDIFLLGSQCVSYNINRQTVSPEIENLEKTDYIFVNQEFRLDKRAALKTNLHDKARNNSQIIYKNEKTKTEVYKTNKLS